MPATLRRTLVQAMTDGADLLSLAPQLSCACLAERALACITTISSRTRVLGHGH
jgi:hypothetical protein